MGRGEVGGRFGGDGDAAGPDGGCLRCRGGGGGGRDAVLVGVRDGGVVVGQQGEEKRRRPAGEVVRVAEGERAQDEGEEQRGQEEGVRQRRQYERLHTQTHTLASSHDPPPLTVNRKLVCQTYQELPRPPNPLHNPQLVEPQHPEQHLGAVREHPPPRHDPPRLPVAPEVRHHGDGQVEAGVGQRGEERGQHGAEDEGAGDGRVGEARGDHGRCACA